MKPLLLVVGLVWVVALAGFAPGGAEPVVQKGQVYLIVESCTTMTGKCFGELHRVTAILDNQWIETAQCEDANCIKASVHWRLNLAHVYAVRPFRGDAHDAH